MQVKTKVVKLYYRLIYPRMMDRGSYNKCYEFLLVHLYNEYMKLFLLNTKNFPSTQVIMTTSSCCDLKLTWQHHNNF
jgi:hypothetical protein